MHEDHRKRLKTRFLRDGLDSFEPHNVLELLLFFSIPQKDTNETAHRLIERFGSLRAVFDAPFDELVKVDGVKEHSATLIKLMPELARRYNSEADKPGKVFSNKYEIAEMLTGKYIGITNETVMMVMVDNKSRYIDTVKFAEGSINSASFSFRRMAELALKYQASGVVIAHNHPGGSTIPSMQDVETTKEIGYALTALGICLIDHFIIAGNEYRSVVDTVPALNKYKPE